MYRNLIKQTHAQQEAITIPSKGITNRIPQNKSQPEQATNNVQVVRLPFTNIQRLSSKKRNQIFMAYSRAQTVFQLKFCTIHLAFSLYVKCCYHPSSQCIPHPYLVASCLYLAMKYQQIYPPSLKEISQYFRQKLDLKEYRHNEVLVLEILKMNLKIQNAATILDQTMAGPRWRRTLRLMGFYLLEIAIVQQNIYDKYSMRQICRAISYLLNFCQDNNSDNEDSASQGTDKIKKLAVFLIYVRTKSQRTDPIFIKYQHQRFNQVSSLPLNGF